MVSEIQGLWARSETIVYACQGYMVCRINSGIKMTNVKIQMTNQIQMFKCLHDCVKNPDHRSALLCRPQGRPVTLKKAAFRRKFVFSLENQSRFNLGTIRSNPFGKSSSFKGRGIPGFNPKPITFLDFGI